MGVPGAYLEIARLERPYRDGELSVKDYAELTCSISHEDRINQASRCMNCGVAFCQSGIPFNGGRISTGCPLHNLIPETNDLLCQGRLDEAAARLLLTNPFPEFTGYVCPAPCETACNLGLNDASVTIHDNERTLADFIWMRGIDPLPAPAHDAPLVSVVGSGPAGLAAAWELSRRGARVRVFERDEKPGGLLMYGIPNMKLPKNVIERRIALMEASGVEFVCNTDAIEHAAELCAQSDAVIIACGARVPRKVEVPGCDLDGIHYALDYLSESTRALLDETEPGITAQGKDVVVIGGGDTGVDCVATALRQGANSVRQVIRAKNPSMLNGAVDVWPGPKDRGTGYGQRESRCVFGEDPRIWEVDTVSFVDGGSGCVTGVALEERRAQGARYEIPAQLVLIAKGFLGAEQNVLDAFDSYENVYLCGDARMGSTLVATAIADGLDVAHKIAAALFD